MQPMHLEAPHGTGVNLVERAGLRLLRRLGGAGAAEPQRWTDAVRRQMRAAAGAAVLWAALAGALSGALIGGSEVLLREPLLDEQAPWLQQWRYWLAYLGIALLVSIAEVVFLYWMMLRKAARIGALAGLGLGSGELEQVLALGLSRAALEIPSPRSPVYGIDPYARVPRWKLIGYTLLYRLKVGATSFILRILLRRVLARASIRVFIPLIAVPVFAVWNALVTAWVMREARIRAAGPLAVRQLGDWLHARLPEIDADGRRLLLEVVGESIMRAHDAHPNFVLLLTRLLQDLELGPQGLGLDWEATRARLAAADPALRRSVLVVALVALLLNGRVRRPQLALLHELNASCATNFDRDWLAALRQRFLHGEGVPIDELAARCGPADVDHDR
jgi:hypothetical protein